MIMKSLKNNGKLPAVVIAFGLLVVGLIVSPRPPSRSRIDPAALYAAVIAREHHDLTTKLNLPSASSVTPLVEGEDVISGHPAWVLRLNPKHKPAPWVQLWVDKRTRSILAFRQWSAKDVLVRAAKVE